jgi:hypothetical protein
MLSKSATTGASTCCEASTKCRSQRLLWADVVTNDEWGRALLSPSNLPTSMYDV